MAEFYEPERDASLGLIFRLNALWERADRRALSGDLNAWELVLDRIFSNLLYREEIETKENGKEEVVDVELSQKDKQIWEVLKKKIKLAKMEVINSFRKKDVQKIRGGKEKHYQSVMMYDIWLRKFMQQDLRLYLKETEKNPSRALFGGAFARKKFGNY